MVYEKKEKELIDSVDNLEKRGECISCKIVVPKIINGNPASYIAGNGGTIEMAMLICCLEDVIKSLKSNFPETAYIIPALKERNFKEDYVKIEKKRKGGF